MRKKQEKDNTGNATVYDRLKRYDLRCSYCRPNKGENKKTCRKHGVKKPKHEAKRAHLGKTKWDIDDIIKIADMVMFLRHDHKGYHYTCKHFDKNTGNCRIYKTRPKMCSAYPYGNECKYKGCTMEGDCGVVK